MNRAHLNTTRRGPGLRRIALLSWLFASLTAAVAGPLFSLDVVDARIAWVELQVKLTDPINPSSITPETLYILNDRGKPERRVRVSADGKWLSVSMKKSWLHRPFVLVMTPALKDVSGRFLSRGLIRVFNVLIHPWTNDKKDWLIKVSENPRIEIEDLRRRVFDWDFFGGRRIALWRGSPFELPGRLSWRDLEDEIPAGGFLTGRNLRGGESLDDERFTDMQVEDVVGYCRQIPRHLRWINQPPQIAVSGVSDGLITKNDVQINISVADRNLFFSYNLLNFELFRSGGVVQREGAYWLFVVAVDKGLKFSYKFLNFEIDKTGPRITALDPAGDFQTNTPELVVRGEVADADKVTVNGQEVVLQDGQFQTAAFTLSPGPNLFTVIASDAAGNSERRSFTATLVTDTTPPLLTIQRPENGSFTNIPSTTVSGTVTDQSAIRSVLVNGNPAALQVET